jgi:hypothetical protein
MRIEGTSQEVEAKCAGCPEFRGADQPSQANNAVNINCGLADDNIVPGRIGDVKSRVQSCSGIKCAENKLDSKDSYGDAEIRTFKGQELPFDIGSLESDAFNLLGEWQEFVRPDGYGLIYRLGIKDGLVDHEGDPMRLFCFFAAPIGTNGKKVTPEIAKEINGALQRLIHQSSLHFSASHDNVVCMHVTMPAYMIEDLKQRFGSDSVR